MIEVPKEAGLEAQQWGSVHVWQLLGMGLIKPFPLLCISPPICSGHSSMAHDLFGFLQSPSSLLHSLFPFELPPTEKGCTNAFYLYLCTERRLISIYPWVLNIHSSKSNEYHLWSSSNSNLVRGLRTLSELKIPYNKYDFAFQYQKIFKLSELWNKKIKSISTAITSTISMRIIIPVRSSLKGIYDTLPCVGSPTHSASRN